MTIADLCKKALAYILTIPIGNLNNKYVPDGYLKADGTGTALKSFSVAVKANHDRYYTDNTVTQTITTYETIDSAYLTATTTDNITSDWNDFVDDNIVPIYIKEKTLNIPISLSSFLTFLYLFRCFIDVKFKLFTDSYDKAYVWLYNTSASTYTIDGTILPLGITTSNMNLAAVNIYINAIIKEIANRDSIHVLKTKITNSYS